MAVAPTSSPAATIDFDALLRELGTAGSSLEVSALIAQALIGLAAQSARTTEQLVQIVGTPAKPYAIAVDPSSITAIAQASASAVKPQIDAVERKAGSLEEGLKAFSVTLDNLNTEQTKANGTLNVLGNRVEHLGNAQNSLHSRFNDIDEQVQRLGREQEVIAVRLLQEMRLEILALVEAECSEPCRRLKEQHDLLVSRCEELEKIARQGAEAERRGSGETSTPRTRRTEGSR